MMMRMATPVFETWEPKDPKLDDVAAAMTAWRERALQSDTVHHIDFGRRTDLEMEPPLNPTTCADLVLRVTTANASADALGAWLGEALQILTTAASLRDPRVLNALWPRQQCLVADCSFCDAMDARVRLEVTLESPYSRCDSALALYHALVSWRMEHATAEFVALVQAIRHSADPHPSSRPCVALVLNLQIGDVIPHYETESMALALGQTLAAVVRVASEGSTSVSDIVVNEAPSGTSVDTFNAFVSAIAASGIAFTIGTRHSLSRSQSSMQPSMMAMAMPMGMSMAPGAPMSLSQEPPVWEWLIGSERRRPTAPAISQLKGLQVSRYEQSTATFLRLCQSLAHSTSLQTLEIAWTWPMDADSRVQEAEAMGMLLFSSQSRLRLQSLSLNASRWSDDDVAAMRRRADRASPPRHERIHVVLHDAFQLRSAPQLVLLAAEQTRRLRFTSTGALNFHSALAVLRQRPQLEALDLGTIRSHEDDRAITAVSSEAPTSSLRELSFTAITDDTPDAASVVRRSIAAMIESVQHSLRTLDVRLLPGDYLDASIASALVTSCRRLRELSVSGHDAAFLDELLRGYRDGHCRIASLSIQVTDEDSATSVIALLKQLEDDSQRVTRWLTRLVINRNQSLKPETLRSISDALVSMLRRNRTLRSIAVIPPLTTADGVGDLDDVTAKFAPQPPSRRHRLALLSALRRRAWELPECVLLHVWAFSGRPLWRLA